MYLEAILAEIGDAGRFQWIFAVLISVMEVIIAWSMLQTAIVGATPRWWCVLPSTLGMDNMTLDNTTFQKCSPTSSSPLQVLLSNGHRDFNSTSSLSGSNVTGEMAMGETTTPPSGCVVYYEPGMSTIVTEWDLVCERKHIRAAINSIQMAGVLVGAVLSGQASDSVGRRKICYITMVIHAVCCLAAGLSNSWQMYAVFRFFVGTAIGSYLVLHFVYVIEFVRYTWRPWLAGIPCWPIAAGFMCLTAWQVPNWRHLHYITAALTALSLLGWFVSPESLRWLAAKGRLDEAEKVVDMIAKMNGSTNSPGTREQLNKLLEEEKAHGEKQQKYTYITLFQGWKNVFKTLVLSFCWMSLSMSFYGIIFGVSALTGNVFLNMFLLSAVEMPLNIIATACLAAYVGRRWTGAIFFFLASLTGFAIIIADQTASDDTKRSVINVIAICSKLFIAAAWACLQIFTSELYPTVIRSLGMGVANTAARVGGILAPFVLEMDTADDALRCYIIVGSVMLASALSVLLLSETKGKVLADTLHQDQKDITI